MVNRDTFVMESLRNARRSASQEQQRRDYLEPPEPSSECCYHDYPRPYRWYRNNATTIMTTSSRDETLLLTRKGEVLVCRHRNHLDEESKTRSGDRHSNDNQNDNANKNHAMLNGTGRTCSTSSTPSREWDHRAYYEPPTLERLRVQDADPEPQSFIQYDPPPSSFNCLSQPNHCNNLSQDSTTSTTSATTAFLISGVPTFHHYLSQIRITKISAYPRGQHVLLISSEGLLFSYGSNEFGQLGLGRNSSRTIPSSLPDSPSSPIGVSSPSSPSPKRQRHFEMTTIPSIVTSLLENGGKSINCAAGIDYSLVVVKTEGARMVGIDRRCRRHQRKKRHLLHQDCEGGVEQQQQQPKFAHHQLYGFGNNDKKKLGLHGDRHNRAGDIVRGDDATIAAAQEASFSPPSSPGSFADSSLDDGISETSWPSTCICLPRRVALECTVVPQCISSPSSLPPYGIFSISASIHHSTALVRLSSGEIEQYGWGKDHALGIESPVSLSPLEKLWEMGCVSGGIEFNQILPSSCPRNHDVNLLPLSECMICKGGTELDKKLRRHVHAINYYDAESSPQRNGSSGAKKVKHAQYHADGTSDPPIGCQEAVAGRVSNGRISSARHDRISINDRLFFGDTGLWYEEY